MEKELKHLDKLEQFFDAKPSEEVTEELDKLLEQEDFKEEATFFQAMVKALEEEGQQQQDAILQDVDVNNVDVDIRAALRAQSKRLNRKTKTAPSEAKIRTLRSIRRVVGIAASVLLLLSAVTFWYINSSPDSVTLASNNYLTADLPGTMSGGNLEEESFQTALNLFAAKDLEAAQISFEQVAATNPKYAEAQYFLGHIHFQQKDFPAAIANYQRALTSTQLPNYINKDKLQWNLLLAKLGAGEDIAVELDALMEQADPPIDRMAKALKIEL